MSSRLRNIAGRGKQLRPLLAAATLAFAAITSTTSASQSAWQPTPQSASTPQSGTPSAAEQSSSSAAKPAPLPRGKKLMLKDGTFQLVREYHVEGDRVRYYSIEQAQWEEMPESLVDWDATRKMEIGEAKKNLDLVAEARKTESMRNAELFNVDASIEIAPKVFLP